MMRYSNYLGMGIFLFGLFLLTGCSSTSETSNNDGLVMSVDCTSQKMEMKIQSIDSINKVIEKSSITYTP